MFTVSVRETHYLFAEHHEANEHCQNHLHSQEEHSHCAVCKFDVSLFTDEIFAPENSPLIFPGNRMDDIYQTRIVNSLISFPSLRGPPALV